MSLKLQIIGQPAVQPGMATSKTFEGTGGSIGRAPDNQWVIQGQYVSGRHARIHWRDDAYYIEDTSTNGVFIGDPNNRLARGQLQRLQDGDRVFIDEFEISVSITPARAFAAPPAAAIIPEDADPFASPSRTRAPLEVPVLAPRGAEADPLKALGLDFAPPPPPGPRLEDIEGGSLLRERVDLPPVREPPRPAPPPPAPPASGGLAIPDDYNPLGGDVAPPARTQAPPAPSRKSAPDPFAGTVDVAPRIPRPGPGGEARANPFEQAGAMRPAPPVAQPATPAPRPASPLPSMPPATPPTALPAACDTSSHPQLDLVTLLEAAGVPSGSISPTLARELGQILRVVVSGVMDALHSRDQIKDEFRIRHTTFKAADNNPLKFSANVEDALYNLLVKRNPAYLGPVEAFEDGFADIRNHQTAMLAGMRMAYDAMLKRFDPQLMQERFDEGGRRGALLAMPARMRYWEQFGEYYRDMVKDPETSFRELFGAEFTRAYEEQLLRLRTLARSQKRDS